MTSSNYMRSRARAELRSRSRPSLVPKPHARTFINIPRKISPSKFSRYKKPRDHQIHSNELSNHINFDNCSEIHNSVALLETSSFKDPNLPNVHCRFLPSVVKLLPQ